MNQAVEVHPCGTSSSVWVSSSPGRSSASSPDGAGGSRKEKASGECSQQSATSGERTARSSNAQALPARKLTRSSSHGSGRVSLAVLLALMLASCCPAAEANVRPLLPLGVEPPTEEQAELARREVAWSYLDAAGQTVGDDPRVVPPMNPVVAVVIPFDDYMLLLGVLDGWRAAARAYRTAGMFRDPRAPENESR